MYIAVYNLYVYGRQLKILYNTSNFFGALKRTSVAHLFLWRTEVLVSYRNLNSVAHEKVRHRDLIFVVKFLRRTIHVPQNLFLVRH
jgi:hypothetical protein